MQVKSYLKLDNFFIKVNKILNNINPQKSFFKKLNQIFIRNSFRSKV